jgi:peptidoglycan/LPS O-acetylase OafA/YrhL
MAGLRGIAVTLVFLVHYVTLTRPWVDPGGLLFRIGVAIESIGYSGVDLFFVLSGYLIYGTFVSRPIPVGTFLRRRVRRIYPTFACVLALYVVLAWLMPESGKLPTDPRVAALYVLENALLMPGMVPGLTPIITLAWSLSYEAFFYLLIPLVVLALGLRSRAASDRLVVTGSVSLVLFALGLIWPDYARLAMFGCGMLLFDTLDRKPIPCARPVGLLAAVIAVATMPVLPTTSAWALFRVALLYACFFVVCFDAIWCRTVTGRVLSWPPLRWLGNMSYSYYLIHGLTVNVGVVGFQHFDSSSGARVVTLMPAVFATTLLTGGGLFAVIERPLSFSEPMRRAKR